MTRLARMRLTNLYERASSANMTLWDYVAAVGSESDRRLVDEYRAQIDSEYCQVALERRAVARGHRYLRFVIALALITGCAGSLEHVNRVGVGLATITTACDWGQTRSAASRGWRDQREVNPLMGSAPSTGTVDAYMGAIVVGTIVLGYVLPARLRPFLYGAVIAVETQTIVGNLDTTRGLCGVGGEPVVSR